MKRFIRALCCALGGLCISVLQIDLGSGGAGVPTAHAGEPPPNASDCMSFQRDVQEKSILVRASNLCDRKFSCSMSYVVRCEDNDGKRTSSKNGNAHFALDAHGAAEVSLPADQCKQAWTIDDVSWQCR